MRSEFNNVKVAALLIGLFVIRRVVFSVVQFYFWNCGLLTSILLPCFI
jgi:hypothetical protein